MKAGHHQRLGKRGVAITVNSPFFVREIDPVGATIFCTFAAFGAIRLVVGVDYGDKSWLGDHNVMTRNRIDLTSIRPPEL